MDEQAEKGILNTLATLAAQAKRQEIALRVLRVATAAALRVCGWQEPFALLEKLEQEHANNDLSLKELQKMMDATRQS